MSRLLITAGASGATEGIADIGAAFVATGLSAAPNVDAAAGRSALSSGFSAFSSGFSASTSVLSALDASLALIQPVEGGLYLGDEVGSGGGPAVLGEGLGGAGAAEAGGRPPSQDTGARVRALCALEPGAPVHEDGARAGQEVALAAASGRGEMSYTALFCFMLIQH